MLIEFFEAADYTFGSPIVLIWGRETEAVAALLIAFRSLAEAQGREVALHVEVPGVQAVGCQVFAVNRQATWLHPEGVYALKAKGTAGVGIVRGGSKWPIRWSRSSQESRPVKRTSTRTFQFPRMPPSFCRLSVPGSIPPTHARRTEDLHSRGRADR